MGHRHSHLLATLVELWDEPVALFASDGRLLFLNRKAVDAAPHLTAFLSGRRGSVQRALSMTSRHLSGEPFEGWHPLDLTHLDWAPPRGLVFEACLLPSAGQTEAVAVRARPFSPETGFRRDHRAQVICAYLTRHFGLTPREAQVAILLSECHPDPQIARLLSISPRTVSHHVAKVLTKLGVSRRWEVRSVVLDG